MKIVTILLASLSCLAMAVPVSEEARDALPWSPTLADYYSKVETHVQDLKRSSDSMGVSCNLAGVQMPAAPTPLPKPNPDYSLLHVAIGRGVQVSTTRLDFSGKATNDSTQNYTCDIKNTTAIPAAIGAVANLYNASCIAANYVDILSLLPELALQLPYPSGNLLSPSRIQQSGVHYFLNASQPVFDLTLAPSHPNLGLTHCAKKANSTAPTTADAGVNGAGAGAVAWLYLTAKSGTGDVKEVYRLDTAGGNPPKTCSGMPPSFSVDYSAIYWFWG